MNERGKNQSDILVIGGGAAGLAAACAAAFLGADVTVLEADRRPGRKILASGNGRCNLMNAGSGAYFHGRALAEAVLERCPQAELRAFFTRCGLRIPEQSEEDGRFYPATGQAASVLDCLRGTAAESGAVILPEKKADAIVPEGDAFAVLCGTERFSAKRVICACGSPAGGRLGRDSYALLRGMGHTMVAPLPALCPVECDMRGLGALRGLRVPAVVTLARGNTRRESAGGEVLFTEWGLSGICAMQLAASAMELYGGRDCVLYLDFSPLLCLAGRRHFHTDRPVSPDAEKVYLLLRERAARESEEACWRGLLPRTLAEVIFRRARGLREAAELLCAFPLRVTGVRAESAQVIRGGIAADEFSRGTLESKRHPGLYAAGEVLDVDGDCGGYNLQFAFASGILAGRDAASHVLKRRIS